jgi:hypothetical protein
MSDNPNALATIVQQSGLEKTKADYVLEKFQDYFKIASDWEQKAKILVVSSPNQTAEMKMAREGRLFLRQKRLDIEKARKELKEQSLREGKAIDGIANVLKALIEPIEEYLDKQERFVEIQEDELREVRKVGRIGEMQSIGLDVTLYDLKNMPEETYKQIIDGQHRAIEQRLEAQQKAEAERIAKEKADAEERERMRAENEHLRKEAEAKERQLAEERAEAESRRKIAEEKARKERLEAEAREKKLKAEQDAQLKKERQERDRLAAELKAKEEKERAEKKRLEEEARKAQRAPDKEKLLALAKSIDALTLPEVKSPEAKAVVRATRELLEKTSHYVQTQTQKL